MKMPPVTITDVEHRMGDQFVTIESKGGASVKMYFPSQIEAIVFDEVLREALRDLAALERTKANLLGPEMGQRDPSA